MGNMNARDGKRKKKRNKKKNKGKYERKTKRHKLTDDVFPLDYDHYDNVEEGANMIMKGFKRNARPSPSTARRVVRDFDFGFENHMFDGDELESKRDKRRRKRDKSEGEAKSSGKLPEDKMEEMELIAPAPEAEDIQPGSPRDLDRQFKMAAKLSTSTRCMKWLSEQPSRSDWSKGATPSTVSMQCVKPGKSLRSTVLKKNHEDCSVELEDNVPETKLSAAKVPLASGKRSSGRRSKKRKSKKTRKSERKVIPSGKVKKKCLFEVELSSEERKKKRKRARKKRREKRLKKEIKKETCVKCEKERWKGRLKPTRKQTKFIYERKHRPGHYISRDKGVTSLGWAILQVIARLEKENKAYPLKILSRLHSKWGFKELNLVGLNSALEWMRQHSLLDCKVTRNKDDRFRVNKSNPSLMKHLNNLSKNKPVPRLEYHSRIPYGVSIKTQLREKEHLKI
uniref:Uncharacterized protein n=1 Tax=Ciona savignyi TaxID=51511 RepID=H2YBP9_CIOSA